MKTSKLFSAGRLAVLALACIATFSITACGDDDPDSNELIGIWRTETAKSGYKETFSFYAGGTGLYSNSEGTKGDFTYQITSPKFVYIKIAYWSNGDVWRDEFGCSYMIEGDKLYLGDRTLIRMD